MALEYFYIQSFMNTFHQKRMISKGISSSLQCNVKLLVLNCDYREKMGLVEKILVLVSTAKIFQNYHVKLQ
jgi:hypothetical protein